MIPTVETILVEELERRIVSCMPETAAAPNDENGEAEPETFISYFDSRKVTRCVQEQSDVTVFCSVEADLHVVFYNQKNRYDFSALLADFAKNPFIRLANSISAKVEMTECEAIAEGPYLGSEVWVFRAEYYIFDLHDAESVQGIYVSQAPIIGMKHKDDYEHMEGTLDEFRNEKTY